MALNPDLISFFLRNIQRSSMTNFGSEVAHLFEHLTNEIKDNPVYDKYQKGIGKWKDWLNKDAETMILPTKYEDAKSLIYFLYQEISVKGNEGYEIPMNLVYTKTGMIDDSVV